MAPQLLCVLGGSRNVRVKGYFLASSLSILETSSLCIPIGSLPSVEPLLLGRGRKESALELFLKRKAAFSSLPRPAVLFPSLTIP